MGCAIALCGLSANAGLPLQPHVALYDVNISFLSGTLRTELIVVDNQYQASSHITPTGISLLFGQGSIVQTSLFGIDQESIQPTRFTSDDSLTREKEQVDFLFDWGANKITGLIGEAGFATQLSSNTYDSVSLQYAFMHDLLNESLRKTYLLQDADELKELNITIKEQQRVTVPFGDFKTIVIQHQSNNSDRTTALWMAAELDFLPIVIEQRRDGKIRFRAELGSYSVIPE
mgnify:CR=1 FL=1